MHPSAPSQHRGTAAQSGCPVTARRFEVVQRLLALGVSAELLEMLLPDWRTVISAAQPLQTGNPT